MGIDYTRRSTPAGPAPSLSKITLTKAAPQVSLAKSGEGAGVLRVNLNWDAQGGGKRGLFASKKPTVDLDLACLYELTGGRKGGVQAVGGLFEARTDGGSRVVWLDGDDRSGARTEGENLFIDLEHAAEIRRVLVFASIYSGASSWSAVNGVVTLHQASGQEIEVRLDESDPSAHMCAIALIENGPTGLQVTREVRYVHGSQRDLDAVYGWGLSWSRGSK